MPYVVGGVAFGSASRTVTQTSGAPCCTGSASKTYTGWTAGAGVEWLFNPKWSVKAEYLYYDLGTANTANIGPLWYSNTKAHALSSAGVRADFDGNVVRLGVNYHLNGFAPAPLLAKY